MVRFSVVRFGYGMKRHVVTPVSRKDGYHYYFPPLRRGRGQKPTAI
jgi:hypothetical protein